MERQGIFFIAVLLLGSLAHAVRVTPLNTPTEELRENRIITDVINTNFPWSDNEVSDSLTLGTGTVFGAIDGSAITNLTSTNITGYLPDTNLRFQNVVEVNTNAYTLGVDDGILHCIYTATGAMTNTLPTAQCVNDRIIVIKDAGGAAFTNNITIVTEGSETIDGSTNLIIINNYDAVMLYSYNTNWFIY